VLCGDIEQLLSYFCLRKVYHGKDPKTRRCHNTNLIERGRNKTEKYSKRKKKTKKGKIRERTKAGIPKQRKKKEKEKGGKPREKKGEGKGEEEGKNLNQDLYEPSKTIKKTKKHLAFRGGGAAESIPSKGIT